MDGLGSGKDSHSWSYSTATTSVKEKTLAVARHVRGVRELDIVESPMGQVLSLGVAVELVALDASTAWKCFAISPGSITSWLSL